MASLVLSFCLVVAVYCAHTDELLAVKHEPTKSKHLHLLRRESGRRTLVSRLTDSLARAAGSSTIALAALASAACAALLDAPPRAAADARLREALACLTVAVDNLMARGGRAAAAAAAVPRVRAARA